jgi:hypothetical protein
MNSKAKNTTLAEVSEAMRFANLMDAIGLESESARDLCDMLRLVFQSAQPDNSTLDLNNAAPGLEAVADIIHDKIVAIREKAGEMYRLTRAVKVGA